MDAAQDVRSKLHTFPRHRWKPAASVNSDDYDDWLLNVTLTQHNHHHQHHHHQQQSTSTSHPSLKSQCDVSPKSKSKSCQTNRFVQSSCSECFTSVSDGAKEPSTTSASSGVQRVSFNENNPELCSCCCSCRRVSATQRIGCWKWSFHNGVTAVAILVATQLLMYLSDALRNALGGRQFLSTTRSTTVTEVQRIVRSLLPLLLLFNMLPMLYAGKSFYSVVSKQW